MLAGAAPWRGIRDALKSTALVFRPSQEGPRGSAGPGTHHHAACPPTRLVGLPGVAGAAGAALGVAAQGQREPMREQALDFCRQLGDRERGAVVLHNLAKATRFQGRFGVARERYEYVESVRSVYVSNSWHAQSR